MRDILKASFKVLVATLSGILGWMVAGKVLALTLGAAGVGLFGLLRQLLQNLTLVGGFNGQTALVQGIASRGTRSEQNRFAGSVMRVQALVAGGVVLVLLIGAPWLGPWLIPHPQAAAFLRWLSLAMLVMVAQTYVIGILNGHRLIDTLVKSQFLGPFAVIALLFPMVWLVRRGHPLGLMLMLGGPAAIVTLVAARAAKRGGYLPALREIAFHRPDAVGFLRMSSVLLISGVITTGAQFYRSWLVARWMGLAEVGQYWTAWTLSMSYVTLVLGSLGTYYMPSLSRLSEPEARRSLIRDYLHLCLLAMPLLVSMVIVFKPWVIRGLFSQELLPSLKVMRWMLIGDLFKGISWVLAFPMLAYMEMRWFFWSEIVFSLGLAATAWVWLRLGGGIEGLGALFMVSYLLYMLVMVYYIRSRHGLVLRAGEILGFLGGLALVGILSWLTWDDVTVRGTVVGVWLLLSLGLTLLLLKWLPGRSPLALLRLMKGR